MRNKRLVKGAALAALAGLALTLAGCSQEPPPNPLTPNDSAVQPGGNSGETTAPTEEESGDPLQQEPVGVDAPAAPEDIDDIEIITDADFEPVEEGVNYYGIDGSEIPVPDAVKEAFPDKTDTLVDSALAFAERGSSNLSLQQTPFDDLNTPATILSYLSDYFTEEGKKRLEEAVYDQTKIRDAFVIAPFLTDTGTFRVGDEIVRPKEGTPWDTYVSDVYIFDDVKNGTAGVGYTISLFITLEDGRDLSQATNVVLAMKPSKDGNHWLVDGWSWASSDMIVVPGSGS